MEMSCGKLEPLKSNKGLVRKKRNYDKENVRFAHF